MDKKPEFYTCIIEWPEGEISYLRVFWAWASHLGEALSKMTECAKAIGISNPIACEADPYEFSNLPDTAITQDEGQTYVDDTIHSFPTRYSYKLPGGVIKCCLEGDYEIEDIAVGYTMDNDEDLICVTAVVEEHNLLSIYSRLIKTLPDIAAFWIRLQDDWEEAGKEEIYVNEELNSFDNISELIEQERLNTLENGHVTITTFSKAGKTNLNISDHKIIVALTYEIDIAERFCDLLTEEGIRVKDELVTIEYGFHHRHYRHPKSQDRQSLISLLQRKGFSYWDPSDPA